jgi:dipeptidyl aminopeptidase/acylaminoacyl peptidase
MNDPRRPFDLVAWLRRGRRPLAVGAVALLAVVAGSALGLVLGPRNGAAGPTAPIAASTASPSASEAPSPSATPTASSTATQTSSPSPTPQPTAAPTATPTAVPTPTPLRGGGMIAFHSGEDIWTVNADGTGLRNLTQTAAIQEENPAWSADGALLAFQSWADGGGVEVMNGDGTGRRRVADGFARNAGYFTDSLAWAPDAHRLAIAFVPGDISIIDVSSGDRIDVGHGTRWLAWSPTGRYLAWGNGATIEAYDSTDGSSFTIAAMSSNVRFLNWFPKEDRLLFVGFNDAGETDLYTVNLDGSGLTGIAMAGGEDGAQLSADGTRVLFSRAHPWPDTAKDDVALLRLGDTEATPVLRVPGLGIARWAPDDARAVAERNGRIFLLRLGAGSALEIANGYAPVWRPLP